MSAYRQNYTPAHQRPAHAFAPGTIEHHVYSRAHQRRALLRWLKRTAALLLCALAVAFAVSLATPARAAEPPSPAVQSPFLPTTLGLHLASHHLGNDGRDWNNANHGIYARWASGLTVGTLRNSLYRQSTYVAWTWEHPVHSRITIGLTAGVTSGYDRLVQDNFAGQPGPGQHTAVRCSATGHCRTVLLKPVLVPLLAPSVAVRITPQLAARLSFLAKTGADAAHAMHLSAEWRF